MMKEEGARIAKDVFSRQIQNGVIRDAEVSSKTIDSAAVGFLVSEFKLGELLNEKDKESITKNTAKKKSNKVREGIYMKKLTADAAKIKEVQTNVLFPRSVSFSDRLEPWSFSVYFWLLNHNVPCVDRLISGEKFFELVEHVPVLSTLIEKALTILRQIPLLAFARYVLEDEYFLIRPSFQGKDPLKLYKEQETVARLLLNVLARRYNSLLIKASEASEASEASTVRSKQALMIRFCTPPSSGKSSAAGYLGAMFGHFQESIFNERKIKRPTM